jgi:hypothetical protein
MGDTDYKFFLKQHKKYMIFHLNEMDGQKTDGFLVPGIVSNDQA